MFHLNLLGYSTVVSFVSEICRPPVVYQHHVTTTDLKAGQNQAALLQTIYPTFEGNSPWVAIPEVSILEATVPEANIPEATIPQATIPGATIPKESVLGGIVRTLNLRYLEVQQPKQAL